MTDQQSNIPEKSTQEVPYGYCLCGCGEKTNIAIRTDSNRGVRKGEHWRYLPHHHPGARGTASGRWKGGKRLDKSGYILILNRSHHRAATDGYVREHILIAEKALGKPLPPGAVVHHVNGSKDNGPLVVCQDHAYHMLIHQRMRAKKECGHANWRHCCFCKKYDSPDNLYTSADGSNIYHRACHAEYEYKRRHNGASISD